MLKVSNKRAKLNATAKVFSAPSTPKEESKGAAVAESSLYDMNSTECDPTYRKAVNAIFGLPFGGSLSFIRNGLTNESFTEFNSFGEGQTMIPTVLVSSGKLAVTVESVGLGNVDEPAARLYVNGKDFSPNQTGFNFLVINPSTMDAYVAVFNTSSQIGNESSHMAKFIYSIDPSCIVLIGVKGDGVRRLHPIARTALAYLGLELPAPDNSEALNEVITEIPVDNDSTADLLNLCAVVNAPQCALRLVQAGWNVNHQKKHGTQNTALLDSVFYGSFNVARVLIQQCQADLSITNKWGESAPVIAEKLFGLKLGEVMEDHENHSMVPKSPDPNSPNAGKRT